MNKDKPLQCGNRSDVLTKVARRLKGCGRKHEHDELETILIAWAKHRNRLLQIYCTESKRTVKRNGTLRLQSLNKLKTKMQKVNQPESATGFKYLV
jgi:hypothetical protein